MRRRFKQVQTACFKICADKVESISNYVQKSSNRKRHQQPADQSETSKSKQAKMATDNVADSEAATGSATASTKQNQNSLSGKYPILGYF